MAGERGGLLLNLKCVLDAPRERIFTMLIEPSELAKWWGPHGFTTPQIELDLSVGGSYRFTMQPPDGEMFHLSGTFLEIDPPSRLAYTFRWEEPTPDDTETVVTLSLVPFGGTTDVSLSQGPFCHRGAARLASQRLDRQLREAARRHRLGPLRTAAMKTPGTGQ
jgi:uncharacterized protein YndB with AHSA1/START domain